MYIRKTIEIKGIYLKQSGLHNMLNSGIQVENSISFRPLTDNNALFIPSILYTSMDAGAHRYLRALS
jgi:hypothetical protein